MAATTTPRTSSIVHTRGSTSIQSIRISHTSTTRRSNERQREESANLVMQALLMPRTKDEPPHLCEERHHDRFDGGKKSEDTKMLEEEVACRIDQCETKNVIQIRRRRYTCSECLPSMSHCHQKRHQPTSMAKCSPQRKNARRTEKLCRFNRTIESYTESF